jgi:DUF4097 and DUF4098 domain-containing protein YvlB
MLFTVAVLAALIPQGTDTTISVRRGAHLELSSTDGDITVQTWNRDAVRVQGDHDEDTRVEIDQNGRAVRIRARARYGPAEVSWRLTVPADMELDLSSQSGDVRVSGTKGEIAVATVAGDIAVQGGGGFIALQSVEGDVELSGTGGRIKVTTVNGGIVIRRADGDIKANAVDGDIVLEDIESSEVEATTIAADISFSGAIRPGGRYGLSSHDGDVTVVAPSIDADVTISTFSGDFESDYPVTVSGSQGRGRMHFTLGTGGARLDLESFDGTVSLRKGPGKRKP